MILSKIFHGEPQPLNQHMSKSTNTTTETQSLPAKKTHHYQFHALAVKVDGDGQLHHWQFETVGEN